jgi:hypothetical protein
MEEMLPLNSKAPAEVATAGYIVDEDDVVLFPAID